MLFTDVIRTKRDGRPLTPGQIDVNELDAMSSRPRREYPRTLDLRRWPSDRT